MPEVTIVTEVQQADTVLEAVAKMHRDLDKVFDRMRRQVPDFKPPCKSGCHFCCFEATFVMDEEVDHILAGLDDVQRQSLILRVKAWLAKARPLLSLPFTMGTKEGIGITWRRANIPCPLLVDGKCSVYDRRPSGCRTFFAMEKPENCEMPMRIHQKFAEFPHPHAVDGPFLEFALQHEGPLKMDHLGVILARKILGLEVDSACQQETEIT